VRYRPAFKAFLWESVPGCLVVLNKHKAPKHRGKILLISASRHFQNANPQNLLRRVDCMRILVPWRAFGNLESCKAVIPEHERSLTRDIERERDNALAEIDAAYSPLLIHLPALRIEISTAQN
jgi:type I restriction enzyme M protein